MAQLGAGPAHDGQAQPHARRRAVMGQALEFVEDAVAVHGRNAHPGVIDRQPAHRSLAPRTHRDAAAMGVLDRVRHQVLRDAAQEDRVAVHDRGSGHEPQPQPLGLRHGREFGRQPAEQVVQRHGLPVELDPLAVQPRDVQHRMHQLFDRFEGAAKPVGQFGLVRVHRRVGQRRQEQARRRQGLQQVVAGSAQETGLGPVRLLGQGAGHRQFAVSLRQVGHRAFQVTRAGQHLLLQRDGGLEHRPCGPARFFQPVDPIDQDGVDAGQLGDLPVGRIVVTQHHRTS